MAANAPPYPPLDLANRVGSLEAAADPFAYYDELGRSAKDSLVEVLPDDWTFEGKRVLDFGCGAGRTMRQFMAEARVSEFWGCDIDRESIDWLDENLSPPFQVFTSGELPPLPLESGSFDLVYAISVFTHLTESWSEWLLDLHRILAPDGILVATFIGEGIAELISGEPWDEDRIGMNILKPGQSWDLGGPMVLHSPWWIRAHWGRAFEIRDLRPAGFGSPPGKGQGIVLMAKRDVELDRMTLAEPERDEPRELSAAAHNVAQLTRELVELRGQYEEVAAAWRREEARREDAERRANDSKAALLRVETSRSWRLTRPLRSGGQMVRSALGRRPR